ncbi:MAG: porin [Oleibacter sp.]|nr:porin [Thalassolituus sp.]
MKKSALTLALATIAASLTTVAHAETVEVKLPTFYGKLNVTQVFVQQENGANYSVLNSNASRIGLKGDIALNYGLTAIYQAEYEVFADNGKDDKSNAFKQRNTFVGVEGAFGLVQAGIFDSALKLSQNKVDLFNDLEGDIKNIVTNSDNRTENTVRYMSPSLGGVVITLDHINGEAVEGDNGTDYQNNGLSSSVAYTLGGWYVAYAYDNGVETEGTEVQRLVTQYNVANVQLGLLVEQEETDGVNEDGGVASVAVKLSDVTLKAQYAMSDIRAIGAESYSLGADYKLAKTAKAFVYATNTEKSEDADSTQFYGAGVEYKF